VIEPEVVGQIAWYCDENSDEETLPEQAAAKSWAACWVGHVVFISNVPVGVVHPAATAAAVFVVDV
jgi:hypothetical protein